MKLKQLVLASAIIAGTYLANAQNNDTHLIKKSTHEYYPIVNFDGKEQQDFLKIHENKEGNYDLFINELNGVEIKPETYLLTLNKNYRHELSDQDNDGDLDLTEKIWGETPNKHKLYLYENINNKLENKVFQRYITDNEFY